MNTIRMLVELTYDEIMWHGGPGETFEWFRDDVLLNAPELLLHSTDHGETVGEIKVLEIMK